MGRALWTPEGMVGVEKDVIPLTRPELITLSRMHEFASKYGLSLVCKKCDSAITGANNNATPAPAVSCTCREWRYTAG